MIWRLLQIIGHGGEIAGVFGHRGEKQCRNNDNRVKRGLMIFKINYILILTCLRDLK